MLQHIKDLPLHVAAIHAVGKVTCKEYENMLAPIFAEQINISGAINYLLVLETDNSNFSLGSCWRDLKLMVKYYSKWNKIAVVTDKRGVEWFTDVFKFVVPAETNGFPLNELDKAIKWVSGK
jgi:hypothetical protein